MKHKYYLSFSTALICVAIPLTAMAQPSPVPRPSAPQQPISQLIVEPVTETSEAPIQDLESTIQDINEKAAQARELVQSAFETTKTVWDAIDVETMHEIVELPPEQKRSLLSTPSPELSALMSSGPANFDTLAASIMANIGAAHDHYRLTVTYACTVSPAGFAKATGIDPNTPAGKAAMAKVKGLQMGVVKPTGNNEPNGEKAGGHYCSCLADKEKICADLNKAMVDRGEPILKGIATKNGTTVAELFDCSFTCDKIDVTTQPGNC